MLGCWKRFLSAANVSRRALLPGSPLATEPKQIAAATAIVRKHKLNDAQSTKLAALAAFSEPASGFPFARAMKRKIICHLGPTNSGKTYAAIEALKASGRGVYCAPLRLLAQEMFDKLNAAGTACSLRTGEVTKLPRRGDFSNWTEAPVVSCTVEMLNLRRIYKVAVIDEVQLIADPQRGWAFTQALLGCCAELVYLCGELAAKELVAKLAADCGEEVEFVEFQRLTPLQLQPQPQPQKKEPRALFPATQLASFNHEEGDCVVAFSRKRIFELRDSIQKSTKRNVAVVYGALPAENRALQAAQFNGQECSILVASDAIGMGLNL